MRTIKHLMLVVVGVVLGFGLPVLADRSAGGVFTYTLPGGPVARTGDTISSNWANSSLTEIQTALSDSLSRSGKGGMTAGLKLIDGSVSGSPGPALYFSSGTNTGLYYSGSPATLHAGVSGGDAQTWTATGAQIPGTLDVTGAASVGGVFTASVDVQFNSTMSVGAAGAGKIDFNLTIPSTATMIATNDLRVGAGGDSFYGAGVGGTAQIGVYDTVPTILSISAAATTFSPDQVVGGIATPVANTDAANKAYVDTDLGADNLLLAPTWTALTGGGGSCSWTTPAWTKIRGIVYLRGNVICTSTSAPTLSTVPQYKRPAATISVFGQDRTTATVVRQGTLDTGGVWSFPAGGAAGIVYSLDGIAYPAGG